MKEIQLALTAAELSAAVETFDAAAERDTAGDRILAAALDYVGAGGDAADVAEVLRRSSGAQRDVKDRLAAVHEELTSIWSEAARALRDPAVMHGAVGHSPLLAAEPALAERGRLLRAELDGTEALAVAVDDLANAIGLSSQLREQVEQARRQLAAAPTIELDGEEEAGGIIERVARWAADRIDAETGLLRLQADEVRALLSTSRGRQIRDLLADQLDLGALNESLDEAVVRTRQPALEDRLHTLLTHKLARYADRAASVWETMVGSDFGGVVAYADSGEAHVLLRGAQSLLEPEYGRAVIVPGVGTFFAGLWSKAGAAQRQPVLTFVPDRGDIEVTVDGRRLPLADTLPAAFTVPLGDLRGFKIRTGGSEVEQVFEVAPEGAGMVEQIALAAVHAWRREQAELVANALDEALSQLPAGSGEGLRAWSDAFEGHDA